jgi:hypothetical protein
VPAVSGATVVSLSVWPWDLQWVMASVSLLVSGSHWA